MEKFKLLTCQEIIDSISLDNKLLSSLTEIYKSIGELNNILSTNSMLDTVILLYKRKEAIGSSKIEGTRSDLDHLIKIQNGITEGITAKQKNDNIEVNNYLDALDYSNIILEKYGKISKNLITEINYKILNGSRGDELKSLDYRKNQNWIGIEGTMIDSAIYVTPNYMQVEILMEDLINFFNNSDSNPILVSSIIHAQFELIHPFMDGNGRTGRLLIPLFLKKAKLFANLDFSISPTLYKNEKKYRESLTDISRKSDWKQWIAFYLGNFRQQLDTLLYISNEVKNKYELIRKISIDKFGKRIYHEETIKYMMKKVIFTVAELSDHLNTNSTTSNIIINELCQIKIDEQSLIDVIDKGKGRRSTKVCSNLLINFYLNLN